MFQTKPAWQQGKRIGFTGCLQRVGGRGLWWVNAISWSAVRLVIRSFRQLSRCWVRREGGTLLLGTGLCLLLTRCCCTGQCYTCEVAHSQHTIRTPSISICFWSRSAPYKSHIACKRLLTQVDSTLRVFTLTDHNRRYWEQEKKWSPQELQTN